VFKILLSQSPLKKYFSILERAGQIQEMLRMSSWSRILAEIRHNSC